MLLALAIALPATGYSKVKKHQEETPYFSSKEERACALGAAIFATSSLLFLFGAIRGVMLTNTAVNGAVAKARSTSIKTNLARLKAKKALTVARAEARDASAVVKNANANIWQAGTRAMRSRIAKRAKKEAKKEAEVTKAVDAIAYRRWDGAEMVGVAAAATTVGSPVSHVLFIAAGCAVGIGWETLNDGGEQDPAINTSQRDRKFPVARYPTGNSRNFDPITKTIGS